MVRRTVDGLARAALADDPAAFSQWVSRRDPSFASRAQLLFANLSALPLTELAFVPEPGERPLPPARQDQLGPDAWAQRVGVSWRLSGDQRPALHRVWLTFVVESGAVRLAGTFDGSNPEPPEQQPSWWRGPLTVAQRDDATVLVGSGQSAGRWADRVAAAVTAVDDGLPPGVPDRAGDVVVEVPATPADFAAVLGRPLDRSTGIAAVAHQVGEGERPPLRVVVNPRSGALVSAGPLAEILRHEIVHLATRSPESPAPLWAVEGLADWVALRSGGTSPGTAELLAAVRRDGPPRSLPGDDAFAAGRPGLNRAYAEAWLACRYVAETWSAADLGRLYAELDRGRPLDEAARAVLGVGAAELTAGWGRFVVRQAEGR